MGKPLCPENLCWKITTNFSETIQIHDKMWVYRPVFQIYIACIDSVKVVEKWVFSRMLKSVFFHKIRGFSLLLLQNLRTQLLNILGIQGIVAYTRNADEKGE